MDRDSSRTSLRRNIKAGHGTHKGVYFLEYKVRNYTMRKYNAYVRRWMPFDTCEGVGFHDADWRSSFGGSIYKKDGSHGCVNMPVKKAKALYSMIEEGCPAITWKRLLFWWM